MKRSDRFNLWTVKAGGKFWGRRWKYGKNMAYTIWSNLTQRPNSHSQFITPCNTFIPLPYTVSKAICMRNILSHLFSTLGGRDRGEAKRKGTLCIRVSWHCRIWYSYKRRSCHSDDSAMPACCVLSHTDMPPLFGLCKSQMENSRWLFCTGMMWSLYEKGKCFHTVFAEKTKMEKLGYHKKKRQSYHMYAHVCALQVYTRRANRFQPFLLAKCLTNAL